MMISSVHSSSDGGASVSSGSSEMKGDMSTSNATSISREQEEYEAKERMFQSESKQVFRLKILVMLILLLAAIAVSLTVYFLTSDSENEKFEASYEGAAELVVGKYRIIHNMLYGGALIWYSGTERLTASFLPIVSQQPFMKSLRRISKLSAH
jgi:hypothetical protein